MGLTQNLGRLSPSIFTDSSLNVGIGGSPSGSYKLEVTGTAKVSSTLLVTGAFEAGRTGGAVTAGDLSVDITSTAAKVIIGRLSSVGSDNTTLIGRNRVGTQVWSIDGGGVATFSSSVTAVGATFSGTTALSSTGGTSQMRIDRSGSVARIQNYDTGSAANISLAWDGGNVGINTTTPSTYLDVSNNGTNNNAYITTRNTGINGYRSGAIFTNSAAGGLSWYLVSTNNGDGDWGGGKFAISTNNAVGVYLNGSTATTWTGQSDIRLKDIDSEIENAIDKVNKLRGVRFTWKSDETKKMQVGLIAQEVKEVLPEAVDFDETNEDYRMGVQYTDLIPLLVNAIKELSAQNQDLKSRLDKARL